LKGKMKMRRTRGLGAIALVAIAGCTKEEAKPKPAGYPSPPLPELVDTALAKGPPRKPDQGYTPPGKIVVPELKAPNLGFLPKDERGRPILGEQQGVRLVVNEAKRDAITAKNACGQRVSACVQRRDLAGGRSIDACWMHTPRCQSDHPWDEPDGCCPSRCQELYEELRKRSYPDLEASRLTLASECFNGMRELMAGTP
jgi:hypothetical protein